MINKKVLLVSLTGTLFCGSALAGEYIKMWPYKDPNWDPEFNLSVTAGQFDPSPNGMQNETSLGLQLSLNCPWFGPPVGALRQQFNLNKVDGDGYDLTTFEINPRWYAVDGNLRYGAGPGFGYMWIKPESSLLGDESSFTLQVSAAIEYRIDNISLSAGTRYQHTSNQDMWGSGDGMNNIITDIKIGFDF
ncbi:MAG: acyloxyacyl hydrolase [Chromatiales bacterium]|nr:acyloxyacyl hydrolase [Chromatiales bacterium]